MAVQRGTGLVKWDWPWRHWSVKWDWPWRHWISSGGRERNKRHIMLLRQLEGWLIWSTVWHLGVGGCIRNKVEGSDSQAERLRRCVLSVLQRVQERHTKSSAKLSIVSSYFTKVLHTMNGPRAVCVGHLYLYLNINIYHSCFIQSQYRACWIHPGNPLNS